MQKGLVEVYTGDGKGKTTSAFGLALRALGRGKKVIIFQFIKSSTSPSGEVIALKKAFPEVEIIQGGRGRFITDKPTEEDIALSKSLYKKILSAVSSGMYDIVVVDEIFPAYNIGLITLDEIIALIERKAENTELVLTGRGAPEEIIKLSHLVTEMREVKHPYKEGIKARIGIEY
ncbi:MAG: cob(I)yrinic acid a,c-diamide adenosyltransferase [bacterium]|nr:cob(I)yrinic acid a,c-diamide adenosyltransferase [bacterium]